MKARTITVHWSDNREEKREARSQAVFSLQWHWWAISLLSERVFYITMSHVHRLVSLSYIRNFSGEKLTTKESYLWCHRSKNVYFSFPHSLPQSTRLKPEKKTYSAHILYFVCSYLSFQMNEVSSFLLLLVFPLLIFYWVTGLCFSEHYWQFLKLQNKECFLNNRLNTDDGK